ncbi:MAG: amidase, partial [Polaromonas sp.]|nr:amidase [Polaromonas sp.]
MKRRHLIRLGLLGSTAVFAVRTPRAVTSAGLFDVAEVTVMALQAAMTAGRVTALALVNAYLARIQAMDRAGPGLNAIIELNPDARAIAAALDRERSAQGPRGPLHGIAVLLKDNIATADRMLTTAGSLALAGTPAVKDAFLVQQLRDAGAVILGKTNLSEWANIRSTRATSGWSTRGGLTRNPYALDRSTSGSSSGSGAAIAASLAAIAVGTETDGSITSPASLAGLVGLKPTRGLISRAGVIPIAPSQDTPGPMARTVADAAALLNVLAGSDPQDTATAQARERKTDFLKALDKNALMGKRIGVVRSQFARHPQQVAAQVWAAVKVLQDQGAVLVDVADIPNTDRYAATELTVLLTEFKASLPQYLATYAPRAPVKTLADVMAFNLQHADRALKYFGQELFALAQATDGLGSKDYLEALAINQQYAGPEGIDAVLAAGQLDALVAPMGGLPWLTDLLHGDSSGAGFSSPAAVAGYPHITVPAGFVQGLPCGLSFVGPAWSDAALIGMAYAYEQASKYRRAPTYPAS